MTESSCLSSGGSVFYTWLIPETLVHGQLEKFFRNNPIGARAVATPLALISGTVKLFLFPLICAVGVVVMPIIALVKACQGTGDYGPWLTAWVFSALGLVASAVFIGVTTFHLPLIASVGVFVSLLSISITVHVHQYIKEPSII